MTDRDDERGGAHDEERVGDVRAPRDVRGPTLRLSRKAVRAEVSVKALTLKQPWAWAVVEAGKWIENRSWEPPQALLGHTFAIHAGLKKPPAEKVEEALRCARESGSRIKAPEEFARGCIVGVATLDGYVSVRDDWEWAYGELASGDRRATRTALRKALRSPWFFGPVGFLLSNVRRLRDPIPCKGALGFWQLPAELERAVRRQRRGAMNASAKTR